MRLIWVIQSNVLCSAHVQKWKRTCCMHWVYYLCEFIFKCNMLIILLCLTFEELQSVSSYIMQNCADFDAVQFIQSLYFWLIDLFQSFSQLYTRKACLNYLKCAFLNVVASSLCQLISPPHLPKIIDVFLYERLCGLWNLEVHKFKNSFFENLIYESQYISFPQPSPIKDVFFCNF